MKCSLFDGDRGVEVFPDVCSKEHEFCVICIDTTCGGGKNSSG